MILFCLHKYNFYDASLINIYMEYFFIINILINYKKKKKNKKYNKSKHYYLIKMERKCCDNVYLSFIVGKTKA